MGDFFLQFEISNYGQLDAFAAQASQATNLGDMGAWFLTFRSGLYGFYARLRGVATHYQQVHQWLPNPRDSIETEYHLASILFNMDSSIECFTYALNAIGFAASPDGFRDVTNASQLRQIKPQDVLGNMSIRPAIPMAGYSTIYPSCKSLWQSKADLINRIQENHDVSKHRSMTNRGGMHRLDPPPGFYEGLGIPDDPSLRSRYWPMAEILITENPKSPWATQIASPARVADTLEAMAAEFTDLVNETGIAALRDARNNIRLSEVPVEEVR